MLYCEQAVEEPSAEYQLARLGGDAAEEPAAEEAAAKPPRRSRPQTSSFTSEVLLDFLERCQAQLADTARWLTEPAATGDASGARAGPAGAISSILRARLRLAVMREPV